MFNLHVSRTGANNMTSYKLYKLTDDQYNKLLEASKPQMAIALQCGDPLETQREQIMKIWQDVGEHHGCQWGTICNARSSDPKEFLAIPK